jgi:ABC-type branched-subunit amino acid transport system ATPase component
MGYQQAFEILQVVYGIRVKRFYGEVKLIIVRNGLGKWSLILVKSIIDFIDTKKLNCIGISYKIF